MCDKNEAMSILDETVRRCAQIMPISDAYLYGSYARGDYRPQSDVDIMLITTLSDSQIRSRNARISQVVGEMCIDHDVTVSVSVRSREQFRPQSLSYHRNIVTKGIRYSAGRI